MFWREQTLCHILNSNDPDISSAWAEREGAYNAALETLIDYFSQSAE